MIEIAICDDDVDFMNSLQEKVIDWFSVRGESIKLHLFSSAQELLLHMNEHICLYLLDIDMPNMTGIDAAIILRKSSPNVPLIFISNDVGSVFDVFKVSPLRFVRKELLTTDLTDSLSAFYATYSIFDQRGAMILSLRQNTTRSIPIKEIMYLTSVKHYVSIHCQTEELIVREKLDYYMKELEKYHFLRVGKSFLINLRYADRLTGSVMILKNGEQIPVSRTYGESVKREYMNYLRKIQQ